MASYSGRKCQGALPNLQHRCYTKRTDNVNSTSVIYGCTWDYVALKLLLSSRARVLIVPT